MDNLYGGFFIGVDAGRLSPQPNDRGVNTRIAKRAVLHGLRPVPKRFAYAFNNGLSK